MEEKKKKPIFKRWWFWAIIVVIVLIAIGSFGNSDDGSNSASAPASNTQSAAQSTVNPTPSPTPSVKTYTDGQYKVGTDLPAGEYVLVSDSMAYFEIAKDSSGTMDSILANDNFTNRCIVTVSKGQYLELSGCTMYAFADAPAVTVQSGILPEGMYKVGTDIKAGEYKVSPDGSDGYVEVSKNSTHILSSIITNDILSGDQYITVKDGQYLTLSSAHLVIG